jgi:hypothetical protein
MNLAFPSPEFDEAVAAVCHDRLSEMQARALNTLLRTNGEACDEYLRRLEVHSRLASTPDLFAGVTTGDAPAAHARFDPVSRPAGSSQNARESVRRRKRVWTMALTAGLALVAFGWWQLRSRAPEVRTGTTSTAVAMLNRVVDAEWMPGGEAPRLGAPLEPGWLRLNAGLAQIVFYSGARVAIQGPAELEIISENGASCRRGRLTAEVPPQARGFRISTPQLGVEDLGTSFGLAVTDRRTEVHVFDGTVEVRTTAGRTKNALPEGRGVVVENAKPIQFIEAGPAAFASLFDMQAKSLAAEARRYDQWRAASERLDDDPALMVHLDFEAGASADWRLRNLGRRSGLVPDATIVGCQWIHGRWPEKRALEFQGVSDRVRLSVPGEFESLTLAAWVRVQGLDRKINSLFMSDGFLPGTIHWLIRNDGVLGLTVIGADPRDHQIVVSPPVLTLDQFGQWLHLAVVLDGAAGRVTHYVNGLPVGGRDLRIAPPFRVGAAELGNWNARGFPGNDPFLIRNFSGAMDEFLLFGRALNAAEIGDLHADGKPQPEPLIRTDRRL